ncbi:MAG: hypothetical protein ABIJ97_13935 [Bacteroidota bacterium]
MKTIFKFQLKQIILLIFLLVAFSCKQVLGQGSNYKTDGNNNGADNNKLGWKNNADLNIVTNDSSRIIVKKEGDVEIIKDLAVNGKITGDSIRVAKVTCDSMNISQYLTADSIHVNSIKIGDSSLWIGGWPTGGPSDVIQTNHQAIGFGRLALFFANIRIGVGTATPPYKLSLFDRNYAILGAAPAVFASFNNQGSGTFSGNGNTFVGSQTGKNAANKKYLSKC